MFWRFLKQVAPVADVACAAHHQLFAYGINWGIGHLGKNLFKVVIDHLRFIGKYRKGSICTHGTYRFLPGRGHVKNNVIYILTVVSVSKVESPQSGAFYGGRRLLPRVKVIKNNSVLFNPFPVWALVRDVFLDFAVRNNSSLACVNQQQFPRHEPSFIPDFSGGKVLYAYLGGHYYKVVVGKNVA